MKGEMADSRTRAGDQQIEPGAISCNEKKVKKCFKKKHIDGGNFKNFINQVAELPMEQVEQRN